MTTKLSRKRPLREESQKMKVHAEGGHKVASWVSIATIIPVIEKRQRNPESVYLMRLEQVQQKL
jgi:hypothetical protein